MDNPNSLIYILLISVWLIPHRARLYQRDVQIVAILQRDGRIAKTALADRIKLSPTPCRELLKRLEKNDIIEGYGVFISWKALGLKPCVIMTAELDSHEAKDFERFEQAVQGYDEIMECWAVGKASITFK